MWRKEKLNDFESAKNCIILSETFYYEKEKNKKDEKNKNKRKRRKMIHDIRSSMDYRGEISDEEDSIIKYEEKREFINQKIKLMNEQVLGKKISSDNNINKEDNPNIVKNEQLELENTKIRDSLHSSNKKSLSENNQKLEIKNIGNNIINDNVRNNEANNSELKLLKNNYLFPNQAEAEKK